MNGLKRMMAASLLVATGLVIAACEGEAPPQRQMPPPMVSAVSVMSRDMPITYEYAGRIGAVKTTEVRARVGGILLHRHFTEGGVVREGDVLFELDPATYEAEVARQKALVAQAEATYRQSVSDAKRAEELLRQKVQSAAQRDQAIALRDANEAALAQARAALQMAELNHQYAQVTAPISGITSREAVSEGSLIASGGLLTTITQSDPAYVNFSYSDTEAREIQQHLQTMRDHGETADHLNVKIRFGDGHEYEKTGIIDFTSPTLDALTGTVGVRAIVDNGQGQLVPGQFVRVEVTGLKIYTAMTIPEQALMQDASGTFVYLVNPQNQVEKRPVTVRRQLANRDWWLEADRAEGDYRQGLADGEKVITQGHFRIQSAFAQMPPGVPLPVMITNLDGQDLAPPTGSPGAGMPAPQNNAPQDSANNGGSAD